MPVPAAFQQQQKILIPLKEAYIIGQHGQKDEGEQQPAIIICQRTNPKAVVRHRSRTEKGRKIRLGFHQVPVNVAVPVRVDRYLLHLPDPVCHLLHEDRISLQVTLLPVQILPVEAGGVRSFIPLEESLIVLPLLVDVEKSGCLLLVQIQRQEVCRQKQ